MSRVLGVLAVVLVCAGCSEEPSTGGTSRASPPASSGPTISGTGYSYEAPEDWGPSPQDIPGFDPDSYAVDLQDSDDGFTDNVNVILSPDGEITAEQAEATAEDELTAGGFTDVSVHDRVTVAGSESAHVTASASMNDTDYAIEQFYPTADGQTFVVTFSFSTSVAESDRTEVTDAVLSSWAWAD